MTKQSKDKELLINDLPVSSAKHKKTPFRIILKADNDNSRLLISHRKPQSTQIKLFLAF